MKIDVKNISYSYNNSKTFAVKDASTSITNGEFVAIVGHTSGEVIVDEYVIKDKIKLKNINLLRKKIGIVFQFPEYQLFEETVEKDILFGPKNFNYEGITFDSNRVEYFYFCKFKGFKEHNLGIKGEFDAGDVQVKFLDYEEVMNAKLFKRDKSMIERAMNEYLLYDINNKK